MRFEWDPKKSAATRNDPNRQFDFAYAATVFADPGHLIEPARNVKYEERLSAIGQADAPEGPILFVVLPGGSMKKKRLAASSRREKLVVRSEEDIRRYAESPEARETTKRLKTLGPDPTAAELVEIPELSDERLARMFRPADLSPEERERLYRPLKKPISVRLDADVLEWLKGKGGQYQTSLNSILRAAMLSERAQ